MKVPFAFLSCRSWLLDSFFSLFLIFALIGCAADRQVKRNLMSGRFSAARGQEVAEKYLVGCPDVLEVSGPHRDLTGRFAVGPDGRVDLGSLGRPRVEGRTPPEIARLIAEMAGLPPEAIAVRVAEFRSQYVYLIGEVVGWQRAVPYQGQETVLDLLQRVGGITTVAEPDDVYVVRSHLSDGGRPQIFHVDLHAIVVKKDDKSNVRLMPHDQVHVGDTRQSRVERCIPRWLRPLYQFIWRTQPQTPQERIERNGMPPSKKG
jgi:protein involved in polysaccharide export with SLBB domain